MERTLVYDDRIEHYKDGRYHNTAGPAIVWNNGDEWWCEDGLFHRSAGPAVIVAEDGQYWFMYGDLHRLDGPAVERADGSKEWWVFGREYVEEFYEQAVTKYVNRLKPRNFDKKES